MKKSIHKFASIRGLFLMVVVLLFVTSGCMQEEKSPIVGTWKLVSWEGTSNDGSGTHKYPGDIEMFDEIFIYSEGYFLFSGRYKVAEDSVSHANYGGGSYTYDTDNYTETIMYFPSEDYIGRTLNYNIEINGDTLIKKGPVDAAENFWGTLTEVYVRMK
jgi:hypothetical protein